MKMATTAANKSRYTDYTSGREGWTSYFCASFLSFSLSLSRSNQQTQHTVIYKTTPDSRIRRPINSATCRRHAGESESGSYKRLTRELAIAAITTNGNIVYRRHGWVNIALFLGLLWSKDAEGDDASRMPPIPIYTWWTWRQSSFNQDGNTFSCSFHLTVSV